MFKFSPPGEPYRLAIAHADGCAEVTGNTFDQVVTLTPWGSIDLTVFWDGKPLSNTPVGMQSGFSSDANCHIDWGGNYTTNADGHVVISAWRPGQIFSDIQLSDPNGADVFQTIEVSQRLKAGEHIELRLLTGKTTIRCALVQPAGSQWGPMTIQPFGPAVNLPADINQMPAKDQIAAVRRAQETAIDPKARESAINFLYISPHADGAIEVMGLKPGTYLLSGFARPIPTADGQPADASPVQRLQRFFSVPSSQPPLMDLGVVSLNPAEKPALNIGDSIPDLAIADLDGKPFSLSALRGKWVLLDFWGTWCGFSIADEPALMDAYDGWADDGRLAMVSASVDDTPEQVRKHSAAARIPWRQLVLGSHDKTAVPRAFGVDGYPTIMLISPEGKLIETNLRGQSLRDALLQNVGAAAGAK